MLYVLISWNFQIFNWPFLFFWDMSAFFTLFADITPNVLGAVHKFTEFANDSGPWNC